MNETEWAIRNLELAGWCDPNSAYNGMVGAAVKNLLLTHQKEGHSGMSHEMTVRLFSAVALREALTLQYWQERYEEHKKLAIERGFEVMTEEAFEEIAMSKPKLKELSERS